MQASLLAWRHLNFPKLEKGAPITLLLPIHIVEILIPSLSTKAPTQYGISEVSDLLNGDILLKLEELEQKYGTSAQLRFTCLRILHFLANHPPPKRNLPPKA